MNTLVVYDSQFGNTEQIAKAIARALNEFGVAYATPVDQIKAETLQEIDLLVLGCPTQRWRPTFAMRAFLATITPGAWNRLDVACFDTRFSLPRLMSGSAACAMVRQMRDLGGLMPMAPESFFVDDVEGPMEVGELQRANTWARALQQQIEAFHPVNRPV